MSKSDVVTGISFNSAQDHFIWSNGDGFFSYSNRGKVRHITSGGFITHCEMINTYTYVLVYANTPTHIFLNVRGINRKCIDVYEPILGLRYHEDELAAIQMYHIYLFEFNTNDGDVDKTIYETDGNPRGLCELKNKMIVFPMISKLGVLKFINTRNGDVMKLQFQRKKVICFALDRTGRYLAVAYFGVSEIYIYNTINDMTFVLRANKIAAEFYHINFSANSNFVCCTSEKGEINIYNTNIIKRNVATSYLLEINALYSFVVNSSRRPCICKFQNSRLIHVVCMDGTAHWVTYHKKKGLWRTVKPAVTFVCETNTSEK